jgi:DNA-binding MurR/RpiR family transcriptional regulator
VRQVFKANLAALEETLEVLELRQVEEAAQGILNCRRLLIIGLVGSAAAVQYAGLRFAPLDLEMHCITDGYAMLTAAALLKGEDALLAVSHSGATRKILDTARLAKDLGVRVIAITSNSLAPLSRLADLVLLTAGRELTTPLDGLASFLCQIAVLDSLFALVQQARPDETRANLTKIEQAFRRPA